MKPSKPISMAALLVIGAVALMATGCAHYRCAEALYEPPPPAAPLGTLSDHHWQIQEANGEASDFVVYQHEFEMNKARLNMAGEDHVKQIAARLHEGRNLPVLVERSMTTARPDTEFQYPVHPNPELDMLRREVVVRSLTAMGIPDADQRVVVAPALAPGQKATEARAAYLRGYSGRGYGGAGFGGFGGGFFGPFTGF